MPPRGLVARMGLLPADLVHAGFYAFVLAASALRVAALPRPLSTFLWYGGALAATVVLARLLRERRSWPAIVPRAVFTVVVAPLSFLRLADVVPHVNPFHQERLLRSLDDWLFFGHNPNEALDRIAWPPLTELLQVDYALYYFVPIALFAFLVAARKPAATMETLFLVLLCLYGSYVGYFLVPATGPNVNEHGLYPPHFADPMPGLWIAEALRAALHEAETIKHDCWPSGHTALSLTCLWIARRESRPAFRTLLVPVVLLVFSTMYLRYHYVVDVLFGVLLAWAVIRFGPRLYRALGARPDPSLDPA
jgi:membrane-associated phospholipid phosphatase